ncbi:hypothetical protein, partial [Eisenbergiella tayi]|uniref:hypothetical protein n=1 Tax=Eisenbergiella tayi TaxID=1432052 RepID=UPI003AF01DEB
SHISNSVPPSSLPSPPVVSAAALRFRPGCFRGFLSANRLGRSVDPVRGVINSPVLTLRILQR